MTDNHFSEGSQRVSPLACEVSLGAIQETALITLWARVAEQRRRRPAFQDPAAVELAERLDYDLRRFRHGRGTQLGVRLRTLEFDRAAQDFLSRFPQGVVVELGAGLNTRRQRVGGEPCRWVDVDLADVIALRRELGWTGEHPPQLTGSLEDSSWLARLPCDPETPLLVLLEGVSMYRPATALAGFLTDLNARFQCADVKFDALGALALRYQHHHDLDDEIRAAFYSSWPQIESLVGARGRWRVLEARSLHEILQDYRRQLPWPLRLAAAFPRRLVPAALREAYFYVTLTNRESLAAR